MQPSDAGCVFRLSSIVSISRVNRHASCAVGALSVSTAAWITARVPRRIIDGSTLWSPSGYAARGNFCRRSADSCVKQVS